MSTFSFTILSETKEIIKYLVDKSFHNTLELPEYCFPNRLSFENKQFVIPYSKKEEFTLFLNKLKEKEEFKEIDGWREKYKEYIEQSWNYRIKNGIFTQVCCDKCGSGNNRKCQCAREQYFQNIKFSELENFVKYFYKIV